MNTFLAVALILIGWVAGTWILAQFMPPAVALTITGICFSAAVAPKS